MDPSWAISSLIYRIGMRNTAILNRSYRSLADQFLGPNDWRFLFLPPMVWFHNPYVYVKTMSVGSQKVILIGGRGWSLLKPSSHLRLNEKKAYKVYYKNHFPPSICWFLKHETRTWHKTILISIVWRDPVFMVYGMPRHANDLLGEVDVFVGITCQCLVVGENPQVRWSRGNFEIVHHHSIVYFIIKYHNPPSFNCLIDSMFMNIYSSYTSLLNQSSQYQLLHKPIPNWKGVWTYPQTLIVNMKERTSPTKKTSKLSFY